MRERIREGGRGFSCVLDSQDAQRILVAAEAVASGWIAACPAIAGPVLAALATRLRDVLFPDARRGG